MSRSIFKKVVRTKFVGQCSYGGSRWEEKVRSTKSANKAFRKLKKV